MYALGSTFFEGLEMVRFRKLIRKRRELEWGLLGPELNSPSIDSDHPKFSHHYYWREVACCV